MSAAAEPQHLGWVVREQRIAAKLTLRKLALMANLTPVQLGEIERGVKVPRAAVLTRVFAAIDKGADPSKRRPAPNRTRPTKRRGM